MITTENIIEWSKPHPLDGGKMTRIHNDEIEFSIVGPILSFKKVAPIPTLLFSIGVCIEKALVTGAPSIPTHCVRFNPNKLKTPLDPA